jgi:hypothetical protein
MPDPKDRPPPDSPEGGKDDLADAYDAMVDQFSRSVKPPGAKPGEKSTSKSPAGGRTSGGKDDLLAAYDKVIAQEEERRLGSHEITRRRVLAPMALTILVAVSAYIWLGRPFDSSIPIAPPIARDSHALRQLMVATAQLVEDYRQQNGRLPTTLEDAGLDGGPVMYQSQGAEYALSGTVGDSTFVLKWASTNSGEVQLEAQGHPGSTL